MEEIFKGGWKMEVEVDWMYLPLACNAFGRKSCQSNSLHVSNQGGQIGKGAAKTLGMREEAKRIKLDALDKRGGVITSG
ncbi:hypothetical protein GOBAR_DD30537 [Gossypium barbadense]|nr:hypothetical protein GOBAR_DD30537 [Gossypium barbadense]